MSTASETTYFLDPSAQTNPRESDRADGRERALVGLLFVGVFVVPATRALTPWLDRTDYPLSPAAVLRVGGLSVVFPTLALLLFWRARRPGTQLVLLAPDPGGAPARHERRLPPRLAPDVRVPVVAERRPRHALADRVAGPAGAALFLPLYALRVPREERMMLERFGDGYRAYMDRAGRVFPLLGRRDR